MKRKLTALLTISALMCASALQCAEPAPNQVVALYEGTAPGSEGWTQKEGMMDATDPRAGASADADALVWNVTHPTLTVFRPAAGKGNGTAIVVAPGGGFRVLSWKNEGLRVAAWLSERGYTTFVLKYRLHRLPDDEAGVRRDMQQMMAGMAGTAASGPPKITIGAEEQAAISDGQRAVALVRSRAAEFGIAPNRVGIIGFSAGGVVSGSAGIADKDRANFVGIIYSNVAGPIPTAAPPAFMAAAADDPLSAAMPDLYTRWRAAGAQAELHMFAKGGHGFGTRKQGLPVDHWMNLFGAWLEQQGFSGGAKP